MKFIKNVFWTIVILFVVIFIFADDEELSTAPTELIGKSTDPNQTWAIYWYLCGSDLESEIGAASGDLEELMQVKLPPNVKVIIETGGAYNWENENVDSDVIQRFTYSSNGLELVDTKPIANMGSADTLADFLRFCKKNYPADKTMMIFWDHGGGTVTGAAFDELYDYDSLTLSEFDQAFRAVYPLSQDNPPFEVIGFDTCLMASIDTAYTFSDIGKYLVASEEFEPGGGWDYTAFMKKLAEDPGMDGARLGQHICDTYYDSCGWFSEDEATLSVVDLKKAQPLFKAYDDLGNEALEIALADPTFFIDLGINAEFSENYGGNTRDQGYANMVDLGDLTRNCADILPKTQQRVLDGLADCVLYQRKGYSRDNASGLSCYYSYNGDEEDFMNYLEQGCSDSFKYLYGYGLIGQIDDEGYEYLDECCGYRNKSLPHVPNIQDDADKEFPVELDQENYTILKLDEKNNQFVTNVFMDLCYLDEANNRILILGKDNDVDRDFEKGIYKDNFRGVWGAIDNHLVYMEVVYDDDERTIFNVPILLNDKEYNLRVSYEVKEDKFKIMGARKPMADTGMADKNVVELKPGDKITPLHYAMSLDDGNDEVVQIPKESFTYTEKSFFEEMDLPNGEYLMMFEITDSKNNSAYSQMINFSLTDEDIAVELLPLDE